MSDYYPGTSGAKGLDGTSRETVEVNGLVEQLPTSHPLDDVHVYIGRFVSYPSPEAQTAHALWIAHTHLMDHWDSTPRLAFLSPEPGSGKSRALEVTALLVPRPVETVNATPAYLFRRLADPSGLPTLLYDEIDTVFGPRAKDNEDVRGMLNAGHRKGAFAGRCVFRGKTIETEELPAYCAVALAGLGNLPDTITSRSVVVSMRRRAPNEVVEPFRDRTQRKEAAPIFSKLVDWAETITHIVFPDMPPGITDRNADVWEALIAVADLAGGNWPVHARAAAVALVTASKAKPPSLGVRLLTDIRAAFGSADQLATTALLDMLIAMEEAPWGDLKGRPLDSRGLARMLSQYDVKPCKLRIGPTTANGYRRAELYDAWQRYVPLPPQASGTSGTSGTGKANDVLLVPDVPFPMREGHSITEGDHCPRCDGTGCAWCG